MKERDVSKVYCNYYNKMPQDERHVSIVRRHLVAQTAFVLTCQGHYLVTVTLLWDDTALTDDLLPALRGSLLLPSSGKSEKIRLKLEALILSEISVTNYQQQTNLA